MEVEGDKENSAKTLPIMRGREISARIAIICIATSIAISPIPYILGYLSIFYIIAVIFADLGFTLCIIGLLKDNSPKNADKIELKLKLNMLIALIAFVLGTL